jgi:hypothetical protein
MLAAGGMGGWGGACRAATGNEWTRTMIALAAMQGLGKPGSNIWSTTSGVPFSGAIMSNFSKRLKLLDEELMASLPVALIFTLMVSLTTSGMLVSQ